MPEAYDPLASSDGIVSLERAAHPPVYKALVESSEANLAFPEPDLGGLREYLAIPDRLAPAVTNWVLACTPAGLPAEFDGAIGIVTRYVQRQFTYRLGVDDGGRDPVTVFMEAREGHCTLFASAAALMLRARHSDGYGGADGPVCRAIRRRACGTKWSGRWHAWNGAGFRRPCGGAGRKPGHAGGCVSPRLFRPTAPPLTTRHSKPIRISATGRHSTRTPCAPGWRRHTER